MGVQILIGFFLSLFDLRFYFFIELKSLKKKKISKRKKKMEIIEYIYKLDKKYPNFLPYLNRLKEFDILSDILNSVTGNLIRNYSRVKQKNKYSNKRIGIRKASLHSKQRKLVNF